MGLENYVLGRAEQEAPGYAALASAQVERLRELDGEIALREQTTRSNRDSSERNASDRTNGSLDSRLSDLHAERERVRSDLAAIVRNIEKLGRDTFAFIQNREQELQKYAANAKGIGEAGGRREYDQGRFGFEHDKRRAAALLPLVQEALRYAQTALSAGKPDGLRNRRSDGPASSSYVPLLPQYTPELVDQLLSNYLQQRDSGATYITPDYSPGPLLGRGTQDGKEPLAEKLLRGTAGDSLGGPGGQVAPLPDLYKRMRAGGHQDSKYDAGGSYTP